MLPPRLEALRQQIRGYVREFCLEPFEVIFEILDYKQISAVAAYGGFPTRYPHWRFGMEFDRLDKGYTYGMQRIYEMVINNDPCYAYLLASNPDFDQKTVMAHVYAHSDFFKNNLWFAHTNRKMMDEIANHSSRIRSYIDRFGLDVVEEFADMALSLENLVDPHSPYIQRKAKPMTEEEKRQSREVPKMKAKKYMERYINPQEYVEEQRQKMKEEEERLERRFPPEPVRDVLQFLIEHAPLKDWQQDVLSIIREEAYYFAPQWMTKVMNEGWATYWHSKIMTERALLDSELVDYADHYAGVVAAGPGQFNPYKLGVELFRDVEDRWNKGKFGPEYVNCENMTAKAEWDMKLGLGKEKIFQVRRLYNDVTFIDEFLTPEFVVEQKLYTFGYNKQRERWEIFSRNFEKVKQQLLMSLTNAGSPFIYVIDANFDNRGELVLQHRHEGVDLKLDYAQHTLQNLQRIWTRPVGIITIFNEKIVLMRYDGREQSMQEISSEKPEEV
ncbi:MAG: SpoVR family protein [Myxococcales bacterium]|nr:MAG: SpoVR family protein [Myxococcales bacterium]